MVIWIVMAALAVAAFLPVLSAVMRSRAGAADTRGQTMAIYRDQLDEVDRDVGRGLIGEKEAAAARTEIARRLIRADDEPKSAETKKAGGWRLAAAAIVAMPVVALAFYLVLGSPELPDQPLAARLSAPTQQQDIATLVSRVEQHLADKPDDGAGWEVIAPVYLRLGRFDDAVRAYGNAVRILGPTAEREGGLGQAVVAANDGNVTAEAQRAFEQAVKLDPEDQRPRFFLALALTQQGKTAEAIAAWQDLLSKAPADAAWTPAAREELARLQIGNKTAPSASAPDAADVEAAARLPSDQQLSMIEGMVSQLAARLESEPNDADGWARLIRSYMVLNRPTDARAALDKAHVALAADAAKLATVDDTARSVGLTP
jgi:cytochrome c-type biogenesis protein CcmH